MHRTNPSIPVSPLHVHAHNLVRSQGQPLSSGNLVHWCSGGDAVAALFDAVQQAQDHINLAGGLGHALVSEPRWEKMWAERCQAGVRVNVVLPAPGGLAPAQDPVLTRLMACGIQVVGPSFAQRIACGLSRQRGCIEGLVVVDGRLAFVAAAFGAEPGAIPDDLRSKGWAPECITGLVSVQGPAVHAFQTLFLERWNLAASEPLQSACYSRPLRACGGQRLLLAQNTGSWRWFAFRNPALWEAMDLARERIALTSGPGWPHPTFVAAVMRAVRRGVCVEWTMPALRGAAGAGEYLGMQLTQRGVRLKEHGPTVFLSESAVVDGLWASMSCMVDTRFNGVSQVDLLVLGREFSNSLPT